MTLTLWLSLVAACLIISLTPGAGAVNTMTTSLLYGWRRSFFTVLGQQLALLTQIGVVAAGLGIIVAQSPIVLTSSGMAAPLIWSTWVFV
ncbi:LysE family transporter [Rothia sp. (in: high G+C Gram-positive bacteria)]|uniref:LysE family transporter n=1 Tax=Rothia sp. (in: high G+C Gram-positive bacteria) TaxID=1885016 RepID=UPI00267DDEFF